MIMNTGHDGVKYSTEICGERARKRRDRQRERGERGRVLLQTSDGVGNKFDR
jgi:hypothetical protein